MTETTVTPSAAASALNAELDQLSLAFEAALSLAGQGEMLELTGLETRVAAACAATRTLPSAEARAMIERLGRMVALLDRLAAALVHNFGNLPRETEVSPRNAAEAYGKGSGGRGQP